MSTNSRPCHICAHLTEGPKCENCGTRNYDHHPKSAPLSLAFAITALIFYIPANILPFMTVELYGNRNSSTIWEGIMSLIEGGSFAIAIVIFMASILIPLLKLLILFYLAASASTSQHQRFKTKLYHFVEAIGRWSMLDIFLLAVLVAVLKLGRWTTVVPEIGSAIFALVVILTMLASAYFDPKIIWENKNENQTQ